VARLCIWIEKVNFLLEKKIEVKLLVLFRTIGSIFFPFVFN